MAAINFSRVGYLKMRKGNSSSQQGAVLIGIIVTIALMAALGGGMLYFTTTSNYNELFVNNQIRAYYAAESGGRFANAIIREAYATESGDPDDLLGTINNEQIFTLSNSQIKFQIKNFIRDNNDPDTIKFKSIGTVGSGIFEAKRELTYKIQPAIQTLGGGTAPGQGEIIVDLDDLAEEGDDYTPTNSMDFVTKTIDNDLALMVNKDQGGGIDAEAYVFNPPTDPNPFFVNWKAAGAVQAGSAYEDGFSSYDLQVKVATGTLANDGNSLTNPPETYANGILFRGSAEKGQQQEFMAVSLVKGGQLASVYPLWEDGHFYDVGDVVVVKSGNNEYFWECISAHTSNKNGNNQKIAGNSAYWTEFTVGPMIVLWIRGSNRGNGDGDWLAYSTLDTAGGDYIVNSFGYVKNWSTLYVRIVEAASIKLTVNEAPNVKIGQIVHGGEGTAKVFRTINDNDNKVVLLLNNINGSFSRPADVNGYQTDSNWGYRLRDNFIWVFYTDIDAHSLNSTPLETSNTNTRNGQPRGEINWIRNDIQNWESPDDKFSLVQWDDKNTEQDTSIRIMGSGKEQGAIIRTSIQDPQFKRPGPYTNNTFPGEIGIVSLGGANDAFFDDFAVYLKGGFSTGNSDGDGSVIVSP